MKNEMTVIRMMVMDEVVLALLKTFSLVQEVMRIRMIYALIEGIQISLQVLTRVNELQNEVIP